MAPGLTVALVAAWPGRGSAGAPVALLVAGLGVAGRPRL